MLVIAALLVCGCDSRESVDELGIMLITMPTGTKVRAEVMTNPTDMARGMMFRDSLAPDRGMLFIHTSPGKYGYWMYQTKIPLDIIWMNSNHQVVEISENTPPCKGAASTCPTYGGAEDSVYVLELAAGMAKRYNVRVGTTLSF